jgi:2-oxoglutarate dehydrogenase E2 component (dihydrolipoamide succinyltransferase)
MKVPSPGESITEVEIATWLVKDGDYVDQAIAEVDSDKATLELPAEGIITLKAEEAVAGAVCLIDTEGAKPEGSDKSEGSSSGPVAEARKAAAAAPAPTPAAATRLRHMLQDTSPAARKF